MITDFTFEEVKKYLPKKKIDSNKYDSGQLLLIGGDNEIPRSNNFSRSNGY